MKNRMRKRLRCQWYQERVIPLTDEEREWLNMVPVGREWGSKDYDRLMRLDALADAAEAGGETATKLLERLPKRQGASAGVIKHIKGDPNYTDDESIQSYLDEKHGNNP